MNDQSYRDEDDSLRQLQEQEELARAEATRREFLAWLASTYSTRNAQGNDMPRISEMTESKYLKQDDVGQDGVIVTIAGFEKSNLAQDGEPPKWKWIMQLDELDKGMVMGPTNLQLAATALGSDNTDEWIGKKIVIYADPNVSFKGKVTGGLRLRAHRKSSGPRQISKPAAKPSVEEINAKLAEASDELSDEDFA